MHIYNVRLGLATNSSSLHKLCFLPENMEAMDHTGCEGGDPRDQGSFHWNYFTAASPAAKMRYLAAMLKERLFNQLPYEIACAVMESWLPEAVWDDEDGIDHQSFMFLPSGFGSKLPDKQFLDELKAYFMQDRLAILGGNDNTQARHYLDTGDNTFHLPIPRDTGLYHTNFVCRYDDQYKYWTLFSTADGAKLRFRLDVSPEDMQDVPEKAYAPELVDLKITDYCPYGCQYCVPPETKILTPFGYKQIDEIQVGDKVYAFNEDTKTRQEEVVEQCHQRDYDGDLVDIEMEDGSIVSLTPNHTVFTERGWIAAENIAEGDEVLHF